MSTPKDILLYNRQTWDRQVECGNVVIRGGDDLATGVTWLAGLTVLVVMNFGLFAFDRWGTGEPIGEPMRTSS
jgi:hypothetical protein